MLIGVGAFPVWVVSFKQASGLIDLQCPISKLGRYLKVGATGMDYAAAVNRMAVVLWSGSELLCGGVAYTIPYAV